MALFGGFFNEYPYRDVENINLDWLLKHYKQIVDDVNALKNWETDTDVDLTELHTEVTRIANEIDSFESEINARFADLDAAIHADFNALTGEIRQELERTVAGIDRKLEIALEQFTAQFLELKNSVEAELNEMKRQINNLAYELEIAIGSFRSEMVDYINERFDLFLQNLPDYEHLLVNNPFRGYQTTIQVAIDDIYAYSAYWGITCRQFDSLELTCEEFEAFELTCTEFDREAYLLLGYPDPETHMIDPFTGLIAPIKDVVYELYELHSGGLTALAFDALELTAEEFDAKEVTAFEFDFFGAEAA